MLVNQAQFARVGRDKLQNLITQTSNNFLLALFKSGSLKINKKMVLAAFYDELANNLIAINNYQAQQQP